MIMVTNFPWSDKLRQQYNQYHPNLDWMDRWKTKYPHMVKDYERILNGLNKLLNDLAEYSDHYTIFHTSPIMPPDTCLNELLEFQQDLRDHLTKIGLKTELVQHYSFNCLDIVW